MFYKLDCNMCMSGKHKELDVSKSVAPKTLILAVLIILLACHLAFYQMEFPYRASVMNSSVKFLVILQLLEIKTMH